MPTKKNPTKKSTSYPPIYRFVIKGDWSRFYKNRRGEEHPLCDPDLIVEFQKSPVAFLTPEVKEENQEFKGIRPRTIKKWGFVSPSSDWGCEYPIIENEKGIIMCFNGAFYEGDMNGHQLWGKGWHQGLTIMNPDALLKHLEKLIKDRKIGNFWCKYTAEESRHKFTSECRELLGDRKSKFFIPKVTFKKV